MTKPWQIKREQLTQQKQELEQEKESYLTQITHQQEGVQKYLTQWQSKAQSAKIRREEKIKDIQKQIQDYLVSLISDIPYEEQKKNKKTISQIEQSLQTNQLATYQSLLKEYDFLEELKEYLTEWENTLTKLNELEKQDKCLTISLKNNNLPNYLELVKRSKELNPNLKITNLETYLSNWKQLQELLKDTENQLKKITDELGKPLCECLHCSHGNGKWTWSGCPTYEAPDHPTIYTDNKWTPPPGWTPFRDAAGYPRNKKGKTKEPELKT